MLIEKKNHKLPSSCYNKTHINLKFENNFK